MSVIKGLGIVCLAVLLAAGAVTASPMVGTVVRFDTVVGTFDVGLYDEAAPITVANFLSYVQGGDYDGSIVHRSVPGFVVQGGGFRLGEAGPEAIPTDGPIVNEPGISNVRGTIGMARFMDPDSATSQWFFNLADNSANLDYQSGGFTVFGEVLGDGMDVVDAIAALPIVDEGGALATLPVVDAGPPIEYVVVRSITVVPEPASLSLLALGATVMIRRRNC